MYSFDHVVGYGAGRDREVASRPQVPTPILLLEVRELLEQDARARALQPLHDLADVLMCPVAQEHVHMLGRHLARDDVQVVLGSDLAQQVARAHRHGARQDTFAVLGHPYDVDLEVVLGVSARSISSHNATSSTLSFA